jgi:cobalt-precorrin 5A hydrolase
MVVGETMIVAGIGSRRGVSTADVIAAVEAALETHGLDVGALSSLATTAFKREEEAIFAAGRELGLPVNVVEDETTRAPVPRPLQGGEVPSEARWRGGGQTRVETLQTATLTHSALSQTLAGTPSVSEAAALAAAGEGASLLGPRIVVGPVTCALAISGDAA